MKSCVSLLSAVCGQPETVMERWLDLYYQVRHAQEKADAAAKAAERLKEAEPFIIPGTLEAVDTRTTARVAPTVKGEAADTEPEPPPEKEAEKADPSQALRASSPQGASQESAEDGGQMAPASAVDDEAAAEPETKPQPEVLRENRVKRPGGKGTPRPSQVGNTWSRDAAVFKRQVRDRLEAVRKKGISAPELVKAETKAGAFTESNVYDILEGKVLKIEIYRALDEALWHFEN